MHLVPAVVLCRPGVRPASIEIRVATRTGLPRLSRLWSVIVIMSTDPPVELITPPTPSLDNAIPQGHRPRNAWHLKARSDAGYGRSSYAGEWHDLRANRWSLVDTYGRLLVALAAALSALSLISSNGTATAVLAVTTAVCSALNAALSPAQRSAGHRAAARDYRHCSRLFGGLCDAVGADTEVRYESLPGLGSNGNIQELGMYLAGDLPPQDLERYGDDLLQYERLLEKVEDASPPIARLLARSPDGTPRSAFGMRAFERQAQRRVEFAKLQRQYDLEAMQAERSPFPMPRPASDGAVGQPR